MSDNFFSLATKLFDSFLSTKPLGLTESHNNLKSKVVSLTKELYMFHYTSNTQPPLVQSIDKINSYLVNSETDLDSFVLKGPKTLQN